MKRYAPLSLTLILVLLGALALSASASAAIPSPSSSPTTPNLALRDAEPEEAEEPEAGEEEFEAEACGADNEFEFGFEGENEDEEFAEEEAAETEEEECGEEGGKKNARSAFVTAPAACLVRQAESSITIQPGSDTVRLTVRYQTYSPTAVTIALKLKDRKGTLAIEHATKHLGAKGVLHLTTKLGDTAMARAIKAQEFQVGLRAANTPGICGGLLEQHLRSKHPVGNARVYTQPVNG